MKAIGYILLLLMFCMTSTDIFAQNDRVSLRHGNRHFKKNSYAQAEVEYKKALESNPDNSQAAYNLGCALMMQNNDSAAVEEFQKAANMERVPLRRAQANHNIGVICQNHKMYGEAIDAYKKSLRDNPHDDETRYNLALCQKLLKENPEQKNQDKNKEKDKNSKDKKNEDKESKDKKDQNKDDKKKSEKPKDQNDRMSKQNAEKLLNAAMRQEKQTQEKLNKMKSQQKSRDLEKNW